MKDFDIPLPHIFVGSLLENGPRENCSTNADVGAFVMEQAMLALGGRPITASSEEGDEILARMMASEAAWNAERQGTANALGWYSRSIDDMIKIAGLMHPEIVDDDVAQSHPSGLFSDAREAQTVFFAAMAITSQNNKVNENLRYALEQYRHFTRHGAFDLTRDHGSKAGAIRFNLDRFNLLYERTDRNLTRVHRLLTMKIKMSDLRAVAARHGIKLYGAELADEQVYGSMIFGPKVGNGFFQNLIGNFDPVTIDLWFMRTWGRYTGTLLRGEIVEGTVDRLCTGLSKAYRNPDMRKLFEDEGLYRDPDEISQMGNDELFSYTKRLRLLWEGLRRAYVRGKIKDDLTPKARQVRRSNDDASTLKARMAWPLAAESIFDSLGEPVDSPRNAAQRRWIRGVVRRALDILSENGHHMTAADLQAVLWYPEKEIYGTLTGRPHEELNTSFDEAMMRMARSEGYADEEIFRVLQSDVGGRRTGRRIPKTFERGIEEGGIRLFG